MFTKKFNQKERDELYAHIQSENIQQLQNSGYYNAIEDTAILMLGIGYVFFNNDNGNELSVVQKKEETWVLIMQKGECVRFASNGCTMLFPVHISDRHRQLMRKEKNPVIRA